MHRHCRLDALFVAFGLCVSLFGGCTQDSAPSPSPTLPSDTSSVSDIEIPTEITLSFNAEDTLNPFSAASRANVELASLLYEGLTRMDNTLTPQNELAATLTADGTTVTATLRKHACFSDGSAVTADDVVGSFALAKTSARYKTLLQNIQSARVNKKDNTVLFTLKTADIGYAACLSFPIVDISTITDKAGKAPHGSGMYQLSKSNTLTVNPHYGTTPSITTVHLLSVSDNNALVHALENGTVDYLFSDLYGGNVPYTTAASIAVDIPYLIFLGVNASNRNIADAQVRKALSLAIDRQALATEGCSGFAREAVSPFHPLRSEMQAEDLPLLNASADRNQAQSLLSAAGYATGLSSDLSRAKSLSLTLLVNANNPFRTATAALLKTQCAAVGIALTVEEEPYQTYLSRIKKKDFDLYLGEVRLPADGSLHSFFHSGGGTSYGIRTSGTCAVSYSDYRSGTVTLTDFLKVFNEELPFIPLNWQKGMAAFKRSYQNISPSALDPYYELGFWGQIDRKARESL